MDKAALVCFLGATCYLSYYPLMLCLCGDESNPCSSLRTFARNRLLPKLARLSLSRETKRKYDVSKDKEWFHVSYLAKYEGVRILARTFDDKVFVLLQEKDDGKIRARIPGGKPEFRDLTRVFDAACRTADREFFEETGIDIGSVPKKLVCATTGGDTGYPSLTYSIRLPLDLLVKYRKLERFVGYVEARIVPKGAKSFVAVDGNGNEYEFVKGDSYCLSQNYEYFK